MTEPAPARRGGFTARQVFSTAGHEPSRRLEAWRRYIGEVYCTLDIDPGPHGTIDGRLSKRGCELLEVSCLQSGWARVKRSKRSAMADKIETFCLVFPTAGRLTYRQHDREGTAGSGDAYVLNAAEAFDVDVVEGSAFVCLTIPCDLLRDRVRGIDDLCGAGGFADPVMASTIRHLLAQALGEEPGIDAHRLQDLCLDMVELMIRPSVRRVNHAAAVADDLFRRAQEIIRRHCTSGTFDLAAAALACGASPRRLQAAMTRQDTTFGRELTAARLRQASRILRSPAHANRQVGEVAADCGFVNQAHFSTRYREHFGRSPSDERRVGAIRAAPAAIGKEKGALAKDDPAAIG